MAWQIMERGIELRSGGLVGPYWMGPAELDQGCYAGSTSTDIQQRYFDGVSLNGLKIGFVDDWPQDLASSDGPACHYIDGSTETDRHPELETTFTDQKSGHWAVMASAIITKGYRLREVAQ